MWVPCDAAKLGASDRGMPLTWGVKNPFDDERLFRVLRADGREMIELVLQPRQVATEDANASFSGISCALAAAWSGLHPIRGETRVEVWIED